MGNLNFNPFLGGTDSPKGIKGLSHRAATAASDNVSHIGLASTGSGDLFAGNTTLAPTTRGPESYNTATLVNLAVGNDPNGDSLHGDTLSRLRTLTGNAEVDFV